MKSKYNNKHIWKILIIICGIIIFSLSLLYTSDLVKKIEIEEKKKMNLWVQSQEWKGNHGQDGLEGRGQGETGRR